MTLDHRATSADIAEHIYGMGEMPQPAHLLTTEPHYRQDWRRGTLARIKPKRRHRWAFVAPLVALGLLAATAAFAQHRHEWHPPSVPSMPSIDPAYIELGPPQAEGAVATLTFQDRTVHSAQHNGDYTLTRDGLTVGVTFTWQHMDKHPDMVTIHPPEGYVAVPRTIRPGEGRKGVAHIYRFRGM